MNTKRAFWLQPNDAGELLKCMVGFLARGSWIVFEGSLGSCDFSRIQMVPSREPPAVNRETDPSEGSQIVLPLECETEAEILSQVLEDNRFIEQIAAIQIIREGEVLFLTGDHFAPECISVGALVPEEFLKELVQRGVLKKYEKRPTRRCS